MDLKISWKDLIYIFANVITVVSALLTLRSRILNIEKTIQSLQNVVFAQNGGLNVIDQATCKQYQDHIYSAIRRGESAMDATIKKIDILNENILLIMFRLEIDPKRIRDRDKVE